MRVLKKVIGFEGYYAADTAGNIYRTERYGRQICRKIALRNKRGYLVAHLCRNGIRRDALAHRLVWEAFNGPIPPHLHINHKNGKRADNRLPNLELCTISGNALHKFRVLGYKKPISPNPGMRNGAAKLNDEQIRKIRKLYAEGMIQREIGAIFGVSQVMIGKIVRREAWSHIA
jgi:hypothetical protein